MECNLIRYAGSKDDTVSIKITLIGEEESDALDKVITNIDCFIARKNLQRMMIKSDCSQLEGRMYLRTLKFSVCKESFNYVRNALSEYSDKYLKSYSKFFR